MSDVILYRITAPHFCAGVVWIHGPAGWQIDPAQCAPILRWMCGRTAADVGRYIRAKGWQTERMEITA